MMWRWIESRTLILLYQNYRRGTLSRITDNIIHDKSSSIQSQTLECKEKKLLEEDVTLIFLALPVATVESSLYLVSQMCTKLTTETILQLTVPRNHCSWKNAKL